MSKYIPGNQKHLSLEDRIYIENELNNDKEFRYLRTVIVTAAVHWGFNSMLRLTTNTSS